MAVALLKDYKRYDNTDDLDQVKNYDKKAIAQIIDMTAYMRPAGSKHEQRFINRFIVPTGAKPDGFGNYILRIGEAPIMWSCHTDTVHHYSGYVTPVLNENTLYLSANSHNDVTCLGADCTAGVWIMIEMIRAGVEGLYIFHREEESGGKGSSYICKNTPELVDGIKFAVAFDRYSDDSIITHQMMRRCCSETFASSLAGVFSKNGLIGYKSDSGGTFTDTALYTDLIPECTNISVGYYSQHCKTEKQDLVHLINLRDVMITADFSSLECERVAGSTERLFDFEDYSWTSYRNMSDYSTKVTLMDVIQMYPERIADMLEAQGYDGDSLLEELYCY